MDKQDLKELKRVANELKPVFNIGKNALTKTFIETIDNYVEAHKIVKIKVLGAEDKAGVLSYAERLSKEIYVEIIDLKGFTFVLYRE